MSLFVALDGPDGCGKSTVARAVVDALRGQGREVVHLREPGSTRFGERVRAALLAPDGEEVDPLAEALAFSAARRAMLDVEVIPALRRGAVVVAERCFLSTVVYQCRAPAEGVAAASEELVRDVTRAVHAEAPHDLIVLLDGDPAVLARRRSTEPDRIERRGAGFHERVRAGFLDLVGERSWVRGLVGRDGSAGEALVVVDAGQAVGRVVEAVLAHILPRLAGAEERP